MTGKEFAARAGMSVNTVYKYKSAGRIDEYTEDGLHRFLEEQAGKVPRGDNALDESEIDTRYRIGRALRMEAQAEREQLRAGNEAGALYAAHEVESAIRTWASAVHAELAALPVRLKAELLATIEEFAEIGPTGQEAVTSVLHQYASRAKARCVQALARHAPDDTVAS